MTLFLVRVGTRPHTDMSCTVKSLHIGAAFRSGWWSQLGEGGEVSSTEARPRCFRHRQGGEVVAEVEAAEGVADELTGSEAAASNDDKAKGTLANRAETRTVSPGGREPPHRGAPSRSSFAQAIAHILGPAQPMGSGKYQIQINEGQGIIIGDGVKVEQHFGTGPKPKRS